MADATIRITDNSGLVGEEFQQACERTLTRIGLQAETFAKEEISRPKPHADGTNRPNVDTGTLRNDISNKVDPNGKSVYVGVNTDYGVFVELGTSRAAPYPFLKPAATEHSDVYKRIVQDELGG